MDILRGSSVDINAENFVRDFVIGEATVGVVGHGYVGKAVEELFNSRCTVKIYDKFARLDTLDDVLSSAQVVFVAVPTPMVNGTGECHTGIVEEVLSDIVSTLARLGRRLDDVVVVLKSTVPPGFTERMRRLHSMRLVFSPEFLTEANATSDFVGATRVVLGGTVEDATVVFKFFEGVWPERVRDGEVIIVHCPSDVAEMVKLFTNALLAARVMFANEIYHICDRLNIDYDEVRRVACLDTRINPSHLLVPGPDGNFGFGGHCFPKDINNLRHVCRMLGVPERLFTAVIDRNDELRADKDWLKMKGRAVVDG